MRYDLVLSNRVAYSYEGYTSLHVARCLETLGIEHNLIYLSDGVGRDYMRFVTDHPPQAMLTFTQLFPYQKPLCDLLHVPQLFWAENSIDEAPHLIDSAYGKIAVPYHHPGALYLLQGAEKRCEKKIFDTVMFAAITDNTPITFEGEALHIFGEHEGNNLLKKLPKNVHLHYTIPYTEHIEVLRRAKKILLAPDQHHWHFQALAAGCEPLTDQPTPPTPTWEEATQTLLEKLHDN